MTRNNKGLNEKSTEKGNKKRLFKPLLLSVIVVAAGIAAGIVLTGGSSKNYPKAREGEMRKTMSPAYFFGKTEKAYRVAQEIPQILDGIYCYCDCQKEHGHKSLLTCFVDRHGSQCGICIGEALMASDLHKEGYKKKEIVEKVNAVYSKRMKQSRF